MGFFKKQASVIPTLTNTRFVVRTMKDDQRDIKEGKSLSGHAEISTPATPAASPTGKAPAFRSATSPFLDHTSTPPSPPWPAPVSNTPIPSVQSQPILATTLPASQPAHPAPAASPLPVGTHVLHLKPKLPSAQPTTPLSIPSTALRSKQVNVPPSLAFQSPAPLPTGPAPVAQPVSPFTLPKALRGKPAIPTPAMPAPSNPASAPTLQTGPIPNTFPLSSPSFGSITIMGEAKLQRSGLLGKLLACIGILGLLGLSVWAYGVWYGYAWPWLAQDTLPSLEEPESAPELPFQIDQPNILSLNTSTVDQATIRELLFQASETMRTAGMNQIVEFRITDQQNNPISFPTFLALMNIKFDQDITTGLENEFSLYLYQDQGHGRVGLRVPLSQDQATLRSAFKKQESGLVKNIAPLFLEDNLTKLTVRPFATSAHKQYSIRYMNIENVPVLSLDYAFSETEWLLGTSKDTMRMLLDRLP